jgi:hypothetical protein
MKFNFPETIFVAKNSAAEQAAHVLSEAKEVQQEIDKSDGRDITKIDLEMMDLLHSAESYFRLRQQGRGKEYVDGLMNTVIEKNDVRGYYGPEHRE